MHRHDLRLMAIAALLFLALAAPARSAGPQGDQAAIRGLMMETWNRPDAPLAVDPVVVQGDFALAAWTQGDSGGRALLRRVAGKWNVHLCSGDALKDAAVLIEVGLPKRIATDLASALARAEGALPPERVQLFSRFDGMAVMDGGDAHAGHPSAGAAAAGATRVK